MYPRWSIIYVGYCAQLSICRFDGRLTKNPDFGTSKIENALFVGRNKNWASWRFTPSQGPRACPIWARFFKLCHDQGLNFFPHLGDIK
jgi:hypothetical protein